MCGISPPARRSRHTGPGANSTSACSASPLPCKAGAVPMRKRIDFNCDLGEGCGDDAAIAPWISSASIACGGHAGDADSMRQTVALCLEHGVAIGAHPGFEDRAQFGRRELPITPEGAHQLVQRQTEALAETTARAGATLHHVKPHGALYNLAARDGAVA